MTEVQSWSTDLVPERAQFPAWAEKVQALHLDWDLATPVKNRYNARIRYGGTESVRLADVRCAAFEGQRGPSSDVAGLVGVQLQLSGRMTGTYGGEQFTLEPGDLFLWDSLRGGTFASDGPHRQVSLLVPSARVPQAIASTLEFSRPLAARPGAGALSIAAGQLRGIAREMEYLTDDAMNRTVSGLLDLLDGAVTPTLDSTSGERAILLAEIQRYILERLDDPQMSVSSIAAAHWISVRSLHLVFSESGVTVAKWVRKQRLERSRHELVNATHPTTVTDVAFKWGFSDASHFSRSFKQEFGVPPSAVMPR